MIYAKKCLKLINFYLQNKTYKKYKFIFCCTGIKNDLQFTIFLASKIDIFANFLLSTMSSFL